MNTDVYVLLLGAVEGTYATAAAFAGEYGIPVAVMDEDIPSYLLRSAFVRETRRVPGIGFDGIFKRAIRDFYEANADKSLILLPMTEDFAKRTLQERDSLEAMFLLPQKIPMKQAECPTPQKALLLVYRGREGSVRTVFCRVAARGEEGAPLAVIAAPTPDGLLQGLEDEGAGMTLYAVCEGDVLVPLNEEGGISPLCAVAAALDTSFAEWMLNDYLLCLPPAENTATEEAVFSLFPFRKVKPYLLKEEKDAVLRLRKKKLFLFFYPPKGERKGPICRAVLNRFYRQSWEIRAKRKK